MRSITIYVDGNPAPQGSKKYVGLRKEGKRKGQAILIEMAKGLKPWRKAVHDASVLAMGEDWIPLDGPLELEVTFWMPRPASHPKTIMTFPVSAPDLSKLIRSTEDSLTTAGVWRDDARVTRTVADEWYALPDSLLKLRDKHPRAWVSPGARITVSERWLALL